MKALDKEQTLASPPPTAIENIGVLAAQICKAPLAAVLLNNNNRLSVESQFGSGLSDNLIDFVNTAYNEFDKSEARIFTNLALHENLQGHALFIGTTQVHFFASVPVKNANGCLLGYLCIMDVEARQITEPQLHSLKLLAQQLATLLQLQGQLTAHKTSQPDYYTDQLNAAFFYAPNAVIILNHSGEVLHWNPQAEITFGWKAEEAITHNFFPTFIPQNYHHIWAEASANMENPTRCALKTVEITAWHKTGNELNIDLSIVPVRLDGHKGYLVFISDITDRKVIATELDKQKVFYENILNKLPTDIAVFDPEHRYLFVNPVAIGNEEFRKFIIGKDDYEYVAYRNRDISVAHSRREKFLQAKNAGKEIRWEESLANPEGEIITRLRRMFPVYNDASELTMVIGIGMDITDRKHLEEQQAQLVKQLSAQNAKLIDFCNIVSHNLRAPLVNMSMLTEYIEKSKDPVEQQFLISKLPPVLDNLHTTFNELVESLQISQDTEIKSEKLEIEAYVSRTIETLQTEIDKLQATIEMDFDEAPVVKFPPKYLLSICHNLISNALKYYSKDRAPLIKLKTRRSGDKIIFSITDNGLGMDIDKHKNNLFKIGKVFHRHPNAKGFGLYMTKTQIEAMGGEIWVESVLNEGSTFYVAFKSQGA